MFYYGSVCVRALFFILFNCDILFLEYFFITHGVVTIHEKYKLTTTNVLFFSIYFNRLLSTEPNEWYVKVTVLTVIKNKLLFFFICINSIVSQPNYNKSKTYVCCVGACNRVHEIPLIKSYNPAMH